MPKVFISYRRIDDHGGVGRIFDRLEQQFGDGNVFIDVDSNMPLGIDFRGFISQQVRQAELVLVIIGPNWGRLIEEKADDPQDFVRLEIVTALEQGIPLVPVCVGKEVAMPTENQLPEAIKHLVYLNGMDIDVGPDFRSHMDRLIRRIEERVAMPEEKAFPEESNPEAEMQSEIPSGPSEVSSIESAGKGRFAKSGPLIRNGEDIDIPTYFRNQARKR